MSFSAKILSWYQEHQRELPWRKTYDPYYIWLSEIILQQTRVIQGLPYYEKFVKAFPTVYHLAEAEEETVLKLWQGLGYYSRARNLHETAKKVVSEYNGSFPTTYKELLKLKGIGDYTASAIVSICYKLPEPVVDGNVYRVLARYYGISLPINSTEGISHFKKVARKVMNEEQIRDYNQGIMEFGAMQCTPKNPNCTACPLSPDCMALKKNRIAELPLKLKKVKIKKRFFNYLVFVNEQRRSLLEQRKGKGIWQNLYQFPLYESKEELKKKEIQAWLAAATHLPVATGIELYNTKIIVHKLSHQHLHVKFWILKTENALTEGIEVENLTKYPVPILVADFIERFNF